MCGIAGIFSSENNVTIESLKKMTDAIAHRGPDGEGHWINTEKSLGFGHRRLSIIDLSDNGKQPMHYANGRYTLTFNGEIYNYIELKQDLEKRGYRFHSASDTEVLLALYDLKKEKCLSDLDGMFAFAIWDEHEKKLFCARDRFGEKPFYYHYQPGKNFFFASEMKALWAAGIPKKQDVSMVSSFLINEYNIFDGNDITRTFFENIKQLDSSHYLILDKNLNLTTKSYYSLDNISINTKISKTDAAEKFRSLLTDSVRLRLRSDVPVGSSLSGGLDSSSIVMLMDQLKGNTTNQNTFSARFSDFHKDEGKHIHEVVNACKNVTCHEVWPTGEEMLNDLEKLFFHQEEPFGSASIYAQWKVMELAKQKNVTVLLDGQGADESLAGYLPYYTLYFEQLFYTQSQKKYESERKKYSTLRETVVRKIESKKTFRMELGRVRRKILHQPIPYYNNLLKNSLKRDMMLSSLKGLLRYADRNAMAHSREVRLPFLSHHLVEFIFSLPDDYLLHEGWTKWVLREGMKSILPNTICWRIDKIGYEPPQNNWLNHPEFKNKIAASKIKCADLFEKETADKISDWSLLSLAYLQ